MTSPSLDGSAVVKVANPANVSSYVLPGLTTSVSNDMILVFVSWQNQASPKALTTNVTSSHLTFAKRSAKIDAGNDHAVEIWWARASGTLSSEVITVTWDNAVAGAAICAQAIQNATGWDTNSSLPKTGGTSTMPGTVSGVSTDNANDLLIYAMTTTTQPGSSFPPPTGYTVIIEQTNFNDIANFATQVVGCLSVSATQSSITVTGGGTGSAGWSLIVDALSNTPPPSGTMAPTEAKDIFAGAGGLLGGSMGATEAKDIFAGVGGKPTGTMAAIEAKDTFKHVGDYTAIGVASPGGWFGSPKLTGVMAAIEAADIFASAGTVPIVPALDGSATGGGAAGGGITSATVTLTTTKANDVIVVQVQSGGFNHHGGVTSVTDTAGLTWKRRLTRRNNFDQFAFEVWWAKAPAPLSADVITVHTASASVIILSAFGVSNANTTNPWDTHTGSGVYRDSVQAGGSSFITGPLASSPVYTNASRTFSFGAYLSVSAPAGTVSTPFTYLDSTSQVDPVSAAFYLATAYNVFTAQQFGTSLIDFTIPSGIPNGTQRAIYLDSIVASDETGTADLIRWFLDGQGNRTVAALAAGENSCTQVLTTYYADSVACIAVLIQGAGLSGPPTVNHIADTVDPNSPHTWTRRSRVTDVTGNLALELWYTQLSAAFFGNVLAVCDNVAAGDILGSITFAVNGPSVFLRGELFDGDPSLPAVKHAETASFQTVGPFNTINVDVLEIALGANISTDLSNSGQLPFLQLSMQPSELVSASPPFNISLQFKFSGPTAVADTAAFNATPKPNHWLMLADAMPVGPPVPPQGVWASVEFKDFTTHTLNYTTIGIASPGGWVGFVPNHGAMAATDAKDRATNRGTFLPLFDSTGWIGFVPAHATLAATEFKDRANGSVWIFGGPVVGRMAFREATDRWSSSNRPTVTGTMALHEAPDRQSSTAFLIPKVPPVPLRPRRLLIVT